jgi:hypothetical protein
LSHDARVGGEVELYIGVALKPLVIFRLVRVEIVKHDMDCGSSRIGGNDLVHKVQELDTPSPLLMCGNDRAGSNLEGGEQGRGAVALVIIDDKKLLGLDLTPQDIAVLREALASRLQQ